MVTEAQDLEKALAEIEAHLRQEEIAIFYGSELEETNYAAEVIWEDDRPDWRAFIKAAKEAGAKVIVIQSERLDEEMLESISGNEEQEDKTIKDMNKHIGEIGQFILFWIQEGVKYTYCQMTPWRSELDEVLSEIEVPPEIEEKSPEELSKELVEYVEQERPDLAGADSLPTTVKTAFWKKKGLGVSGIFGNQEIDEDIAEKVETVEELAMEMWEQRVREKERKIVPRLIEECDEWARENGLRALSRGNLAAFLDEKGQKLGQTTHETIYRKVNVLLKRMSNKEKEALPRLVNEFAKWATEHGYEKVTGAHVSEFLDEKDQILSQPAREALYRKVIVSSRARV